MSKIITWVKENIFGIITTIAIILVLGNQFSASVELAQYIKDLEIQNENAQTALALSSGKAVYMAGASCTIKTTPDVTPAEVEKLSRACVKAHKQYLEDSAEHRSNTETTPQAPQATAVQGEKSDKQ